MQVLFGLFGVKRDISLNIKGKNPQLKAKKCSFNGLHLIVRASDDIMTSHQIICTENLNHL
jgi:hypothetical protein